MGSKYEIDRGDQIIAIADVSGSMNTTEQIYGGATRIKTLGESYLTLVKEALKLDSEVDFLTFGQEVKHTIVTEANVDSVFAKLKANEGFTNTHLVVKKAWEIHQDKVKNGHTDNTIVFIATDGAPTDFPALVKQLKDIAAQQEAGDERFSVSFLLVGTVDPDLDAALTKLDDEPMKDKNGAEIDFIDKKNLLDIDFSSAASGALGD